MIRKKKGRHRFSSKNSVGWKTIMKTIAILVSFLGISVFGLYQYGVGLYRHWHPKISITLKTFMNPSEPFSAYFLVENQGNSDLTQYEFVCQLNEALTKTGSYHSVRDLPTSKKGVLGAHQKDTQVCAPRINSVLRDVSKADISVTVTGRWPWLFVQSARFQAECKPDGAWEWLEKPETRKIVFIHDSALLVDP